MHTFSHNKRLMKKMIRKLSTNSYEIFRQGKNRQLHFYSMKDFHFFSLQCDFFPNFQWCTTSIFSRIKAFWGLKGSLRVFRHYATYRRHFGKTFSPHIFCFFSNFFKTSPFSKFSGWHFWLWLGLVGLLRNLQKVYGFFRHCVTLFFETVLLNGTLSLLKSFWLGKC